MKKQTNEKGLCGIGVFHMKHECNYGTLFRTAQILGVDFIFLIGKRFKRQASDVLKSWRNIPLFEYKDIDDFSKHRPYSTELIGVELTPEAEPIKDFIHPKCCCYLLGAEDHGLNNECLRKCNKIICLPGNKSLNVAVAGSIVLFDRINKQ